MSNKEKKQKYLDAYGLQGLHLMLKKDGYTHLSFSNKTVPTIGSHCGKIEKFNEPKDLQVNKVIVHTKKDAVTLFVNDGGVVQYLKL